MERFEKLSRLYVSRLMRPAWDTCGDVEHDEWTSLRLFLLGYAFERQGRSPDYAPAATDAIDEVRGKSLTEDMALEVWSRFAKKLGNRGLNHANNPLCPRGVRYVRKYRGRRVESTTRKISAVELGAQSRVPLVAWAHAKIVGDGLRKAHKEVRRIGGISDKIASFFLRDVAVRYDLAPKNDRHLLQPIDTWVKFVVRRLNGNEEMDQASCARFIVDNAQLPERANQGIWYFCAVVAGSSRYVVRRCLEDIERYNTVLDRHLSSLEAGTTAVRDFNEENSEQ